jgi:hypothetical protein
MRTGAPEDPAGFAVIVEEVRYAAVAESGVHETFSWSPTSVAVTRVGAAGAGGTITDTVADAVCETRLDCDVLGDGLTVNVSCSVVALGGVTLSDTVVLAPGMRPPGTVLVHAQPTRV